MTPILVIDDQKGIRSLIATVLKDLGQEVELAEDGQEGIELLFLDSEPDGERRRLHRKKVTLPETIIVKNGSKCQAHPGAILNISRSGVLVAYAKGGDMHFTSRVELPHLKLCFSVPQSRQELCFDCVSRHMWDTGQEIQVGASFSDPSEQSLGMLTPYLM